MFGKLGLMRNFALSVGALLLQIVAFSSACDQEQIEEQLLSEDMRAAQNGLLSAGAKSSPSLKIDSSRPVLEKKLDKVVLDRDLIREWLKNMGEDTDTGDTPDTETEEENPTTPMPSTGEPSLADYGPPTRLVGLLMATGEEKGEDPCPRPRPDTGWTGGRLFSVELFAAELCDEIGKTEDSCLYDMRKKIVSFGLPEKAFSTTGIYCEYHYTGEEGSRADSSSPGKNELLEWKYLKPLLSDFHCTKASGGGMKFLCHPGNEAMELEVDPAMVVPQGAGLENFVRRTREIQHDFALTHLGYLENLPPSLYKVRIAVLDSSPPAKKNIGMPVRGQLPHGFAVGLLNRNLACPTNGALEPEGDCMVAVDHFLALDLERDESGNIVSNKEKGGFFGTPTNLGLQLWKAIVRHGLLFSDERLVINLSVGAENISDWSPYDMAGDVVILGLRFAACHGAITFGAAGKQRQGSQMKSGPVWPASLESYDQTGCGQLLYAVGGLDGMNRPLLSTRENGLPKLAAHAYKVVTDAGYAEPGRLLGVDFEPPFSGSSMSTAAVSGMAALLLSLNGYIDNDSLVNHILYGSGDSISPPRTADFCSPQDRYFGSCPETRRVSLCHSLKMLFPELYCEPILDEEPTWTGEMFDMLEADAGVIDTSVHVDAGTYHEVTPPTPPTPPWVCGDYSVYLPSHDDSPNYVCADRQLFNAQVFTYLSPEPPHTGCGVCGIDRARDFLYVMLEEQSQVAETAPVPVPGTVPTSTHRVGELLSMELKLTDNAGDVSTYLLASGTSSQGSTIEDLQDGSFVGFDLTNVTQGTSFSQAEIVRVVQGYDNQDLVVTDQIPLVD